MTEDARYLTLARITRPRGNRGEVLAENLAGGVDRFAQVSKVRAVLPGRPALELGIDSAWEHKGRLVLKFEGVESIDDAERLRHAEVRATREQLGPLPEGEFYFDDLVGCSVVDLDSGSEVGTVTGIDEPPGGALLFTIEDGRGGELMIPFANEICREVDVEAKRIGVRLPEGLAELKV